MDGITGNRSNGNFPYNLLQLAVYYVPSSSGSESRPCQLDKAPDQYLGSSKLRRNQCVFSLNHWLTSVYYRDINWAHSLQIPKLSSFFANSSLPVFHLTLADPETQQWIICPSDHNQSFIKIVLSCIFHFNVSRKWVRILNPYLNTVSISL
jgi:hypothetical protein